MTRRNTPGLALVAAVALSACSFFREPLPDDSCNSREDCFQGAGEVCLKVYDGAPGEGTCGIPPDAGPDATPPPDGPPVPDAPPPAPDGALLDGGAVDAGGVDA